jgi:hypothetical protein
VLIRVQQRVEGSTHQALLQEEGKAQGQFSCFRALVPALLSDLQLSLISSNLCSNVILTDRPSHTALYNSQCTHIWAPQFSLCPLTQPSVSLWHLHLCDCMQ